MKLFPYFYNGKIGVVDLTLQSSYMVDFEEEAIQRHLLGASMNAWLLTQYESDSLVLGTGPLTGSFAPASSLLVATHRSPVYDHLCHVPFMLRTGPEMKFSGVDYLVIRGAAQRSCAVSVNRGQIRVLELPHSKDRPIPDLLQLLRQQAPAFRSSIVTGPAADRNSPYSSASVGSHGSSDKTGLASRMAAKNLKAILFNGIGGLPHREDHPALSKAMEKMLRDSGAMKTGGFVPILKKLADGGESAGALRGKLGRNRACYHCPCPCMTYASVKKQAADREKDGLLLMDHSGWTALARKSEDALSILRKCLELGLDPWAVGYGLREDRPLREALNVIEKLASAESSIGEEDYPSAPYIDTRSFRIFGGGIAPLLSGELWTERVATAMILGICPIFLQIASRLNRSDLLRFLSSDAEEIRDLDEHIKGNIEMLLEGKIPDSGLGDRG